MTLDTPDFQSAASRLCAACGMCCDGVMFQAVVLQVGESAGGLQGLGLRVRRKKKVEFVAQPCPAHRDSGCRIYGDRPARCRMFECRQLGLVRSGEATEDVAMTRILEARRLVSQANELMKNTNFKKPLVERYETAMSLPPEDSGEATLRLRARLSAVMEELEGVLKRDFRVA